MFMSACDVYKALKMGEEAMECYFLAGNKEEAVRLAEELKLTNATPKLFCILGDIYKSEEYYLKSWEVSNQKYSSA
jgi:hypothetical protein